MTTYANNFELLCAIQKNLRDCSDLYIEKRIGNGEIGMNLRLLASNINEYLDKSINGEPPKKKVKRVKKLRKSPKKRKK